jgi:heme exporter protein CcmD
MEWWKFNGYGFYVWGSYLTAFAVAVIEMTLLRARRARALRRIDELEESR